MKISYILNQPLISGSMWINCLIANGIKDNFEVEFFFMNQNQCKNNNLLSFLDENNIKYQICDTSSYINYFKWLKTKIKNNEIVSYTNIYYFDIDFLKTHKNIITKHGQNDLGIKYIEDNNLSQYFERIILVSESCKNQLSIELLNKSIVIKNNIDISYLKNNKEIIKNKLGIKENDFVISWVGRLSDKSKRSDILLDIINHYKNIIFIIYSSSFGLSKEDRLFWNNLENENIIFIWDILPYNILDYLSISNIYLHTSDIEGLSLSTLEAYSINIPIISSSACGQNEIVRHGKNGFLCNSINDYIKYINFIVENKFIVKNNKYNFNRFIQKYKNIYNGVK